MQTAVKPGVCLAPRKAPGQMLLHHLQPRLVLAADDRPLDQPVRWIGFARPGRPWPLPHRASRLPRRLGLMEAALGLVRTDVVPHAPQREAKDIVGPFPECGRVTEAAARH
jgi:hypothetical protein